IGTLGGSASADANLAVGETRLPSGVVVRINDAASSTEEIKRKLEEKFGTTVEERRKALEALKSAVEAERFQIKLGIINALNYTIQSICDEYIRYTFRFYTRTLHPSLKEVAIDVLGRESRRSEGECIYKVTQYPRITREDGSLLAEIAL